MEDFFQQHATIPAEMLGDAMHLLNMNPTADEAYFAFCGSVGQIDESAGSKPQCRQKLVVCKSSCPSNRVPKLQVLAECRNNYYFYSFSAFSSSFFCLSFVLYYIGHRDPIASLQQYELQTPAMPAQREALETLNPEGPTVARKLEHHCPHDPKVKYRESRV